MKRLVFWMVRAYQWTISPIVHLIVGPGSGCRFYPSCSEYFLNSVEEWGLWDGGWLAAKRLLSCNPFSKKCGWDPVPRRSEGSN